MFSNSIYFLIAKEDTLVQATLAAIPEEAVKRGVFSENALRERFLKVSERNLLFVSINKNKSYCLFFCYLKIQG